MDSPASPITRPVEGAEAGPIHVVDRSGLMKALIRSGRGPAVACGRAARVGEAMVCSFRPDEWLILGSDDACAATVAGLPDDGFTSVIDVTHGRAVIELAGDAARRVLGALCDLDLGDDMTPPGATASAVVAGVVCDIVFDDDDEPLVLLVADRSYAQSLYDAIVEVVTRGEGAAAHV